MRGFPGSSAGKKKKIRLQGRTPGFNSWVEKIRWRRDRLPTPAFLGFPCGLAGKESACDAGDLGSALGLRRSAGEGIGYPLPHSWAPLVAQLVQNPPMVQEAWARSPMRCGSAGAWPRSLPAPIFRAVCCFTVSSLFCFSL